MQRLSRAAIRIHTPGIQKRTMAVHNVAVAGFGEGTNELVSVRQPTSDILETLRETGCALPRATVQHCLLLREIFIPLKRMT